MSARNQDMFTSIAIKNFKCLRDVAVDLRPLTVAIGKNNTGKSTFLEALACAAPGGFSPPTLSGWGFQNNGAGTRVVPQPLGQRVAVRYTLPIGGPQIRGSGIADTGGPPALGSAGEGIAGLVDWMLRRDRPRFFKLVEAMKERIPGVTEVNVSTPTPETRTLALVAENGWTVEADRLSAGARLTLFFLALTWHPMPPDLVLIEEPENGVHPGRLHDIMKLLRGLVDGTNAPKKAQVVLSTHSPYLLDDVRIPDDQVLVFERLPDGACTARPLDEARIAPFLRDFGLGEVWLNEGEQCLVHKA